MAFGINRNELKSWKKNVKNGEIDILTHYWLDDRFPNSYCVTKVGCSNLHKLMEWGQRYGLDPNWIHQDERYPHYDLFGDYQREVLQKEGKYDQIKRFNLGLKK